MIRRENRLTVNRMTPAITSDSERMDTIITILHKVEALADYLHDPAIRSTAVSSMGIIIRHMEEIKAEVKE